MTGLATLATREDRCAQGFALIHHPQFCDCSDMGEWAVFIAALHKAVGADGLVHQSDVRPLIRGRIAPKHIGTLYRRAKTAGLLVQVGKEPSTDTAGRNTHHDSPVYELRTR